MAFTFGFYNSLDGDRKYNATQMSEIFDGIIRDGVFSSVDEIFATVPGEGMQVLVKSGRAWFNHTWNKNDAAYPLNIDPAHVTLSRIDTVVLEVNSDITARRNRLLIVKGAAATTPIKPALIDNETLHQHPLAYITIPPAATAITAGMISVCVGKSECPFVTGPLETANIDDLFQQWEYDFEAWFENVQTQLTENVVTNLQYQIDQRVKIADKATIEEAQLGESDVKWMTPLKSKQAITQSAEPLLSIGDIKTSARDLELLTSGQYIRADGRSLTVSAYSELNAAIGSRVLKPHALTNYTMGSGGYNAGSNPRGAAGPNGEYIISISDTTFNDASTRVYWAHYNSAGTKLGGATISLTGSYSHSFKAFWYNGTTPYALYHNGTAAIVYKISGSTLTQIWSQNCSNVYWSGVYFVSTTMYLSIVIDTTAYCLTVNDITVSSSARSDNPAGATLNCFLLGDYVYAKGTSQNLRAPATGGAFAAIPSAATPMVTLMNMSGFSPKAVNLVGDVGVFYAGSDFYIARATGGTITAELISVVNQTTLILPTSSINSYYGFNVDNQGNIQGCVTQSSSSPPGNADITALGAYLDGVLLLTDTFTWTREATYGQTRPIWDNHPSGSGVLFLHASMDVGGTSDKYSIIRVLRASTTQFRIPKAAATLPNMLFIKTRN